MVGQFRPITEDIIMTELKFKKLIGYSVNDFRLLLASVDDQYYRLTVTAPWSTREKPVKLERRFQFTDDELNRAKAKMAEMSGGATRFNMSYASPDSELAFDDKLCHFKACKPKAASATVETIETATPSAASLEAAIHASNTRTPSARGQMPGAMLSAVNKALGKS